MVGRSDIWHINLQIGCCLTVAKLGGSLHNGHNHLMCSIKQMAVDMKYSGPQLPSGILDIDQGVKCQGLCLKCPQTSVHYLAYQPPFYALYNTKAQSQILQFKGGTFWLELTVWVPSGHSLSISSSFPTWPAFHKQSVCLSLWYCAKSPLCRWAQVGTNQQRKSTSMYKSS